MSSANTSLLAAAKAFKKKQQTALTSLYSATSSASVSSDQSQSSDSKPARNSLQKTGPHESSNTKGFSGSSSSNTLPGNDSVAAVLAQRLGAGMARNKSYSWLDIPLASTATSQIPAVSISSSAYSSSLNSPAHSLQNDSEFSSSQQPLKKKQRIHTPTINPTDTHAGTTIGTQLHSIIKFLSSNPGPSSLSTISVHLNLPNLTQDDTLLGLLKQDERVIYLPKVDLFQLKPDFDIKSEQDLWDVIVDNFTSSSATSTSTSTKHPNNSASSKAGTSIKPLLASWSQSVAVLDEWESQKKIYVLKGISREKYVFPNLFNQTSIENGTNVQDEIDNSFKLAWSELQLPLAHAEIQAELSSNGIAIAKSNANKGSAGLTNGKKPPKKRNQKIQKLTNDHVKGVDLNSVSLIELLSKIECLFRVQNL